jgi:hypothetical protein
MRWRSIYRSRIGTGLQIASHRVLCGEGGTPLSCPAQGARQMPPASPSWACPSLRWSKVRKFERKLGNPRLVLLHCSSLIIVSNKLLLPSLADLSFTSETIGRVDRRATKLSSDDCRTALPLIARPHTHAYSCVHPSYRAARARLLDPLDHFENPFACPNVESGWPGSLLRQH